MIGLGSASSLGIGLAVWMDDKFTQGARTVRSELGLMRKDMNDFADGMARLDKIGSGLASIGDNIIKAGVDSYKAFAKFDNITNSTRAIIGNMEKTDPEYARMIDQAHQLGDTWGILSDDVASAQLEIAKAGRNAKDVMGMTEAVMALGAASETLVGGDKGAAVMLSDIMNAYGFGVDKAMYVSDMLTSAANRSTLNVTDFYESLKYSADIAKQFNIPLEETTAVLSALGNAGLKGSMAGTGYANMIRYLGKAVTPFASKKQVAALKMLGLGPKDLLDAKGEMKDISSLLDKFREKAMGLSGPMRAAVFSDIFGVRGNRPFEALLNNFVMDENLNKMGATSEMLKQVNEDLANNITLTTARAKMDDAQGPIDRMSSAWLNLKQAVGKALMPIFDPLIKLMGWAARLLTKFSDTALGQWVIRLGFILGGVGMAFVGRLLAYGARFAIMMMASAGRLTNAFQMGQLASRSISGSIVAASNVFLNNMLRARGIISFATRGGTPMLAGVGPGGRFSGGRVARSGLSTTMGLLFGRSGLKMAGSLTKFFTTGAIGKFFGVFSKLTGVFSVLFKALGFLGRIFFSWWFVLADLVSVLITGKSLFEWIWDGLKWLGKMFGIGGGPDDPNKPKNSPKPFETYNPDDSKLPKAVLIDVNQTGRKDAAVVSTGKNINLNVVVNPTTGDKRTERQINLNTERQINSLNLT